MDPSGAVKSGIDDNLKQLRNEIDLVLLEFASTEEQSYPAQQTPEDTDTHALSGGRVRVLISANDLISMLFHSDQQKPRHTDRRPSTKVTATVSERRERYTEIPVLL